ncbi:MAG: hypothetical protein H7Y18_20370 [Clostridiaceae bacterium]|nr:hypothetical protein [Clostridiaceae bacterium]
MNCNIFKIKVYDYLDGEIIDEVLLLSIQQHLEECTCCNDLYKTKIKVKEQFTSELTYKNILFASRNIQVMNEIKSDYYKDSIFNRLSLYLKRNRFKFVGHFVVIALSIFFITNLKYSISVFENSVFQIESKLNISLKLKSINEIEDNIPDGMWLYNNKILVKDVHNLRIYDLKTREYVSVNDEVNGYLDDFTISRDGKKIIYKYSVTERKENPYWIYNVENKTKIQLNSKEDIWDVSFDDTGRYIIGEIANLTPQKFIIVDTSKGTSNIIDTKTFDFKLNSNDPIQISNSYSLDGKNIFFKLTTWRAVSLTLSDNYKYGIYKYSLKYPTTVEPLLWLKDNGDSILKYDIIDNGKSIIFNGKYHGELGVFIFNLESKNVKNALTNLKIANTNILFLNYELSSDKTKIAYSIKLSEENSIGKYNIYTAILSGDTLYGDIKICSDMASIIDPIFIDKRSSGWSLDNKQLLLTTSEMPESNDDPFAAIHNSITYKYRYFLVTFN